MLLCQKKTRVIAPSDSGDEIIFSTESNFLVTFAKITKIFGIYRDYSSFDVKIYDHTNPASCTNKPNENQVIPPPAQK